MKRKRPLKYNEPTLFYKNSFFLRGYGISLFNQLKFREYGILKKILGCRNCTSQECLISDPCRECGISNFCFQCMGQDYVCNRCYETQIIKYCPGCHPFNEKYPISLFYEDKDYFRVMLHSKIEDYNKWEEVQDNSKLPIPDLPRRLCEDCEYKNWLKVCKKNNIIYI